MIMKKSKNILIALISLLFLLLFVVASMNIKAYATGSLEDGSNVELEESGDNATPRLFASLSLSIKGGDHKVIATVKNDFTLFPSTVNVIVQLYYSETYCEDYNQMTLAAMNSTDDLNMGNTIDVEAPTDGEERFWMARMRFRENDGNWKSDTVTGRYSADGTYLGIA